MDIEKITVGACGFLLGAVGMLVIESLQAPNINSARIFQREGKPNAMRLYRDNASNGILVQENNSGKYMLLSNYLSTIQNKADRGIEEAEIKKVVEWYE